MAMTGPSRVAPLPLRLAAGERTGTAIEARARWGLETLRPPGESDAD